VRENLFQGYPRLAFSDLNQRDEYDPVMKKYGFTAFKLSEKRDVGSNAT
jgi:hypothetical protein